MPLAAEHRHAERHKPRRQESGRVHQAEGLGYRDTAHYILKGRVTLPVCNARYRKEVLRDVEAVGVHYFRPGCDEVFDKLLVIIVLSIDLRVRTQQRVGTKDQIHA